jgi:hypothetical protein
MKQELMRQDDQRSFASEPPAVVAIRILNGINQHDHFGQNLSLKFVIVVSQQVICRKKTRLQRRDLVSMHAIAQPGHSRQIGHYHRGLRLRSAARI